MDWGVAGRSHGLHGWTRIGMGKKKWGRKVCREDRSPLRTLRGHLPLWGRLRGERVARRHLSL